MNVSTGASPQGAVRLQDLTRPSPAKLELGLDLQFGFDLGRLIQDMDERQGEIAAFQRHPLPTRSL